MKFHLLKIAFKDKIRKDPVLELGISLGLIAIIVVAVVKHFFGG